MAQRFVGLCPRVCTMGMGLEYTRELVVSLDICGFEHLPTLREARVVSAPHVLRLQREIGSVWSHQQEPASRLWDLISHI